MQENVPYPHVAAITVIFFVATTTTACAVTDLGVVFQFIGGIAGSLLIFVLPGSLLIADGRPRGGFQAIADAGGASTSAAAGLAPVLPPDAVRAAQEYVDRVAGGSEAQQYADGVAGGLEAPDGVSLEAKPAWHSSWDKPWVGYVLVSVGVCVIALTLYTAISELLTGAAPAGEGGGLQDAFAGDGSGRALRALSVALAA